MSFNKVKAKLVNKAFYMLNHGYSFFASHNFLLKHTPFVLHIRITSHCNLSCPFCYLKEGLNQKEVGLLTIEEWEKILSPLPKRTIIDITGAEPFMAKDFDKFLILLKRLGLKSSVTTNGTLYNDHVFKTIIESNIEYILISLDGLRELHNSLRGSPLAFDKTVHFTKELKRKAKESGKKLLFNIKTMLLDENKDEIIPLIRFIDNELNPDIITVNLPFQNEARGGLLFKEELSDERLQQGNTFKFKSPEDILKVLNEIEDLKKTLKTPIIFKPSLSMAMLKEYIKKPGNLTANSCKLYQDNLTLYYDGSLTPCDISYSFTNIRELDYDLSAAYQNKKFKELQSQMKEHNKVCEGCVFSNQVLKK